MGWDLAALLLILNPDAPVPPESPQMYAALVRQAWALDLAAPWEGWGQYRSEVQWCRNHYRMMQDYPNSWDAGRWDSRHVLEWFDFQQSFRDYLEESPALTVEYRNAAIADTDWRMVAYMKVLAIHSGRIKTWDRRWELQQLRCLLGPADYYAGRLPDPVPAWAFVEVGR